MVAFYYDYERLDRRGNPERIRGVVSKAYKYPGLIGMVLHAYNGLNYFRERCEIDHFDFGLPVNAFPVSDWGSLNMAFDVFFEQKYVEPGFDTVSHVLNRWDKYEEEYKSGDRLGSDLFNCEGFYGWLDISFTGNPSDGYETKHNYYFRGESRSIQGAADKYYSDKKENWHGEEPFEEYYKDEMELVYEIASYFNDNTTLLSADENVEAMSVSLIRELLEQKWREEEEASKYVSALNISTRSAICLHRNGIETIEELKELSEDELASLNRMTPKCLEEIKAALIEHEKNTSGK